MNMKLQICIYSETTIKIILLRHKRMKLKETYKEKSYKRNQLEAREKNALND